MKNTLILITFSFLVNGINFILLPIYTNYLTVEEYGIMATVIISTTFFTTFFTLGLNGAISRIYFEIESYIDKLKLISSAFLTIIIVSSFVLVLILLTNGSIVSFFFNTIKFKPYIKISIFTAFFNVFSIVQLSLLLIKGEALKYRLLTSTYFILNTIFSLFYLIFLKQGLYGILKAQLLANFIMAIYYLLTTINYKKIFFDFTYFKKLIIFGLPLMIYNILGILIELSSKYFVGKYLSFKDLGIYNLSFQVASLIILVNSAINMSWIPIYFEISKFDENSKIFTIFSKYLFLVISFIAFLVTVFYKLAFLFFINKDFEITYKYMPLLLFIFVIGNTYWILFINPIFQAKKTKYLPFISFLSGFSTIVACIFLIPKFGLYGAIIAVFIGYLTMNIPAYFIVNKYLTLRYNHIIILCIILNSIFFSFISILYTPKNLLFLIIYKLLVVLFYLFTTFYFNHFNKSEIKALIFRNFNQL